MCRGLHSRFLLLSIVICVSSVPQETSPSLNIAVPKLPKALLWEAYSFQLTGSGGIPPYRWRQASGSLPAGFELTPTGEIKGTTGKSESSEFTISVTDSSRVPRQFRKTLALATEVPLVSQWKRRPKVSGQRIDGSIKVSNRTGRDFDLTVISLAVNDIGRATAIGYQHFSLKRDTPEVEIPFGDTLSRGNYVVNVDAVGEEPISNRVFRGRLVTGRMAIVEGP